MPRVITFELDQDETEEQFGRRRSRQARRGEEGRSRHQPLSDEEARELGRKPRRARQIARSQIIDLAV